MKYFIISYNYPQDLLPPVLPKTKNSIIEKIVSLIIIIVGLLYLFYDKLQCTVSCE